MPSITRSGDSPAKQIRNQFLYAAPKSSPGATDTPAFKHSFTTSVTLRPRIAWVDEGPDPAALADLHHKAHEACFIANSVKTEVVVDF